MKTTTQMVAVRIQNNIALSVEAEGSWAAVHKGLAGFFVILDDGAARSQVWHETADAAADAFVALVGENDACVAMGFC